MSLRFLWAVAAAFFCLYAWAQTAPPAGVAVGDWIFRQGTGLESAVIMQLSGSRYSHVGVITAVSPEIRIVHATTDDDPSETNQVRESGFAEFTSPKLAHAWQIVRPAFLDAAARQELARRVAGQMGLPFVLASRDVPHRYCTTLIADFLPAAVQEKLHWQTLDFPGTRGEMLYPEALLALPRMERVAASVP